MEEEEAGAGAPPSSAALGQNVSAKRRGGKREGMAWSKVAMESDRMAGHGSSPGVRQGGRKRGTPNKITADARETFRQVFESLAPECEEWIRRAAEKNPAKGAELLLRLAEHFVPKLTRTEVTGADSAPLVVEVVQYGEPSQEPNRAQLEPIGM